MGVDPRANQPPQAEAYATETHVNTALHQAKADVWHP